MCQLTAALCFYVSALCFYVYVLSMKFELLSRNQIEVKSRLHCIDIYRDYGKNKPRLSCPNLVP